MRGGVMEHLLIKTEYATFIGYRSILFNLDYSIRANSASCFRSLSATGNRNVSASVGIVHCELVTANFRTISCSKGFAVDTASLHLCV